MCVEVNRSSSSSTVNVANTAEDNDYEYKKTDRQSDGQRDPVCLILIVGRDWWGRRACPGEDTGRTRRKMMRDMESQMSYLCRFTPLVTYRKKSKPNCDKKSSSRVRVRVCLPGPRLVFDQIIF